MRTGYLTIDDGPSPGMRSKVDFLVSREIPAIFFCRGDFLEQRPEAAVHAIRNGFIIGNHAYDHPHFSELDLEDAFQQIRQTDWVIDRVYEKSGVSRRAKVFRFPYGDKGGGKDVENGWPEDHREFIEAVQRFLVRLGYRQPAFKGIRHRRFLDAGLLRDADVHWTFTTLEWGIYKDQNECGVKTLHDVTRRINVELDEGSSSEIFLVHDHPHPQNAEVFAPIVEALLAKGFRFELPEF